MKLSVGSEAPDFELPADDGSTFRLSAVREPLLLVFYPGDGTPVCTAQLCDYRDGIEVFRDAAIRVVGISKDSAESHQSFRAKHDLPFTLLTDAEGQVASEFGVRTLLGTTNRALFLLGRDRTVLWLHRETLSVFRRTREELKTVIEDLVAHGSL